MFMESFQYCINIHTCLFFWVDLIYIYDFS